MDDATLERACLELVSAGSAAEVAQAAEALAPSVVAQVRALAARNPRLFRDAGLEPEDVAQEVLRRLIESPPRNPERRDPVAAVLGWARAVAINIALDRRRRAVRESPPRAVANDDRDDAIDSERPAEEVLAVLGDIRRMHAESVTLASYKYMRETFGVLVRDPDVTALELARRVGLIEAEEGGDSDDYRIRSKKAAQYAWKLRQRMLDLLAARMGCGRRGMANAERES